VAAKGKTAESADPTTWEKKDDPSGAVLSADREPKVAVSSSASTEASQSREPSSVVQIEEEVIATKPELADVASGAGQDRNETESPYVPPKVDQASLPTAPVAAPIPEEHNVTASPESLLREQPLLENQQAKAAPPERSAALPAPKVLQGFVIQLAFEEIRDARLWAETLERQGFSVSLTEAGGGGSVRVRIGNFPGREEAERHLQVLRRQGLKGVILNLPQPYQPGFHPVTGDSGNTLSAIQ
jgi:cell division protein FtsN